MYNSASSLRGLRILNTRPSGVHQQQTNETLTALGAVAIGWPALVIASLDTRWVKKLPNLTTVQAIIFVSQHAVRYFMDGLVAHGIVCPISTHVIAIGTATANVLKSYGFLTVMQPNESTSEVLLQLPVLQNISGEKYLLVKGLYGRTLIQRVLKSRGAVVQSLAVYKRNPPPVSCELILNLWQTNAIDMILFTSVTAMKETIAAFYHCGGASAVNWLYEKPCLVNSERLLKAAFKLGMKYPIRKDLL